MEKRKKNEFKFKENNLFGKFYLIILKFFSYIEKKKTFLFFFFSSFFHLLSFFLQISFFEEKQFSGFLYFSNEFVKEIKNNENTILLKGIVKEIKENRESICSARKKKINFWKNDYSIIQTDDLENKLSISFKKYKELFDFEKNFLTGENYKETIVQKEQIKKKIDKLQEYLEYLINNRNLSISKLIWHCSWWSSLTSFITLFFFFFELFLSLFYLVIEKIGKKVKKNEILSNYLRFVVLVWNFMSLIFFFIFGLLLYFPKKENYFDKFYLLGFFEISRIYFFLIYQILWHFISPLFFIFYFFNKHKVYSLLEKNKKKFSFYSLFSVLLWHFFIFLRPHFFNFPTNANIIAKGIFITYPYDYFFWIINFNSKNFNNKLNEFKYFSFDFIYRNFLTFFVYYFISVIYLKLLSFLSKIQKDK